MSLIAQIKKTQIEYRKLGLPATVSVLSTLIGEAEAIGKNAGNREVTDAEVITLTKKFVDANNQNIERYIAMGEQIKADTLKVENAIYSQFLPVQLSEAELRTIITGIITPGAKIGDVIKSLKASHEGQYDTKLASIIIKELLV